MIIRGPGIRGIPGPCCFLLSVDVNGHGAIEFDVLETSWAGSGFALAEEDAGGVAVDVELDAYRAVVFER